MIESKRLFRTLAVANFLLYFGFNIWQAVFNNMAVEEMGVRADQIGVMQAIREVPGLLGFVMAFIVMWLSEKRVLGLSVLLLGVGLVLSGVSNTLMTLTIGTLVMSFGFHFFYPSNASLVLMGVGQDDAPRWLGRLNSVASLSAVIGTVVIWLLVEGTDWGPLHIPAWGYRKLLLVVGGLVMAGSVITLFDGRQRGAQRERRKIIFRRDYWVYYALTFLMGSRRHIFTTFAIFLLVDVYGIDVRQAALLFLVNNLISTYAWAQLGKLVARWGERKVLTLNFVGVTLIFMGYAYVTALPALYLLFVADHVLSGFGLAVDSYFQKIAHGPEEITSNVSMAQTINHIAALVVPVVGGILWEQVSPSATFLAGMVLTIVSLGLVQLIRPRAELAPAVA